MKCRSHLLFDELIIAKELSHKYHTGAFNDFALEE